MSAHSSGSAGGATVQSGQAFTCILGDDKPDLDVRLEAAIDAAADLRTRFVRAGNPLRSPLTVERLLIQASGNDAESYYDRTAEELARIVAGPQADETRVVLVVEQAETLDPDAIRVLLEMTACSGGAMPKLLVLFAGHTSFKAMLDGRPGAVATQGAAQTEAPLAAVEIAPPMPVASPASHEPTPIAPLPRRPSRAGRVLLFLLLLAAVILGVLWVSHPDQAALVSGHVQALIGRLRGG